MRIFSTPSQASDFETRYMTRPITDPPMRHAVPTLWERAKAMFVTTLTRAGPAIRLAFRRVWRRQLRRDLIQHVEPIEKLFRVLMIIEAITLLVMTPDGLKLRQTTQPSRIPKRTLPRRHDDHRRPTSTHRSARCRARSRRGGAEAHGPATRTAPSTLPRSLILDDVTLSTFNTQARASIDPPDEDDGLTGPMFPLARRIAALERILANPWPAIRRLRAARWAQGCPDFYNLCLLARSAFAALDRACGLPPHEPG